MSTREFQFTDGSSAKFWRITLDGSSHTVQYGRIGTTGQTQTKSFEDETRAAASYQKLIAEKVGKGYVENASLSSAPTSPTPAAPTPVKTTAPARKASANSTPQEADAPAAPAVEIEWPPRRALNLDPADWLWATWRPHTPLVRPVAAPFDQAAAAERLAKIPVASYGWDWDWDRLGLAPSMTREEAHFWLMAMTSIEARTKPAALASTLRTVSFDGVIDVASVRDHLTMRMRALRPEIMLPLANLFDLTGLLAVIAVDPLNSTPGYHGSSANLVLASGFRTYVLPYLTADEIATVRDYLRTIWPSLSWPVDFHQIPPVAYFLGAVTGLHDEVRALVTSMPDDMYGKSTWQDDYYHHPQEIVFGLSDPREVEAHMRRLRLPLRSAAHVRAWLAHTEYAALDQVRDGVLEHANKETAAELLQAFVTVVAPEAAPHMLQLMLDSKAPSIARTWLDEHPAHTIAGLVPVVAGRGRLADAAADLLRRYARRDYRDLIARAIDEAQVEDAERLRASVLNGEQELRVFDDATTPNWLSEALRDTGTKRRATPWVQASDLPPILVDGQRLNDAQVGVVLAALQSSKLDQPHPLIAALKAQANPMSLDTFAWALFQLWLAEGGPSKENWALRAVGLLGGDGSVLRLTPLIRTWPGESQHARAVLGLEVLRTIGSDTALMQINGIAQKLQFKGLQGKAREAIGDIARERGFTPEQLEDRIVPDCDLDSRGSRDFDFGSRSFEFVLGPDLKPLIRDESGKVKSDLPKPAAKDETSAAQQAVAEWKLLKKQVAEVAKIQVVRLEQAMVTGRRWSGEELQRLLIDHPLMTHLVQRMVWAVYDAGGAITTSFRVTEDRTLADSADETFELEPTATVGIVHPLQLSTDERNVWGELLSDYEIVQPFAQLGRPTYALTADEQQAREITRFKEIPIPVKALVFTLDKLGWERGTPMDGGVFDEHSRPFVAADVTAVVMYDGVPVGYYDDWEDQKMERCFFVQGITGPYGYRTTDKALPLAKLDPVVISEVLHDLSIVASKGK